MKRKVAIAAATAAVIVAGGAAATTAFAGEDAPRTVPQSSVRLSSADQDDEQGKDQREAGAAKVSASEAIAAALRAVPGTASGADLDDDEEDGGLVWEVDVLGKDGAWHDITVDAGDAKVLSRHVERDDDEDADDRAEEKQARQDLRDAGVDAARAAEKAAARGTVTSVDLEDDSDRFGAVWEAEVVGKDGVEHELAVDLESGKVTAWATDEDDDVTAGDRHGSARDDDRATAGRDRDDDGHHDQDGSDDQDDRGDDADD